MSIPKAKSEKPQNQTFIKTVESGAFLKTIWRKNGKRTQKTVKMEKNMQKVVLGTIGDFEVYVYPYDYPDKVFIGKFPVSTMITSTNVQQVLGVYNQMKWFLSNAPFSKPTNRKGANMRRQQIVSAYNLGLKSKTRPNKAGKTPNYN